jgi:hypothetical protein
VIRTSATEGPALTCSNCLIFKARQASDTDR